MLYQHPSQLSPRRLPGALRIGAIILALLAIFYVWLIAMPQKDAAEQDAALAIYLNCVPPDGQTRVIRNRGGNIDCGERHVAMGRSM